MTYKEMFVRKYSNEEIRTANETKMIDMAPVKRGEKEKTKLPRRIVKPANKELSCPHLYKIPEEIPLNKRFPFAGRNEVCITQTHNTYLNFY